MAVYTNISHAQLSRFLSHYTLGALLSFEGIAEGVSNTNYLVSTEAGQYVLTLYEPHRVNEADLPFVLSYTDHLAKQGLPCPAAVTNNAGEQVSVLADRPAVLVPFFPGAGRHFDSVTVEDCRRAGRMAARMHIAGASLADQKPNAYGHEQLAVWIDEMGDGLNDIACGFYDMAQHELSRQIRCAPDDIPRGAIHGDYFPDNVLFSKAGDITAVLDFHFACTDFFAYDLAIMVNAWCFSEADGIKFEGDRYQEFLTGYEEKRPLTSRERDCLPVLFRGAALRTALARCEELLNHDPAHLMTPHDPRAYIKRLEYWQNEQDS